MRVSVTREETLERTWACERCGAGGFVVLRAVGESGWKQVWWSRDAAEDAAHEDAKWAVQRDADRMLGMIRCPTCHLRAKGVYAWAVIRNIVPFFIGTLMGVALAAMALAFAHFPIWTGAPIMFACGALMCLPERRRWVEARNTTIRDLIPGDPEKAALIRAKKTEAAMPKAVARELPAPKKEALAPVTAQAPQPIDRPSDDEGPRFLRDKA